MTFLIDYNNEERILELSETAFERYKSKETQYLLDQRFVSILFDCDGGGESLFRRVYEDEHLTSHDIVTILAITDSLALSARQVENLADLAEKGNESRSLDKYLDACEVKGKVEGKAKQRLPISVPVAGPPSPYQSKPDYQKLERMRNIVLTQGRSAAEIDAQLNVKKQEYQKRVTEAQKAVEAAARVEEIACQKAIQEEQNNVKIKLDELESIKDQITKGGEYIYTMVRIEESQGRSFVPGKENWEPVFEKLDNSGELLDNDNFKKVKSSLFNKLTDFLKVDIEEVDVDLLANKLRQLSVSKVKELSDVLQDTRHIDFFTAALKSFTEEEDVDSAAMFSFQIIGCVLAEIENRKLLLESLIPISYEVRNTVTKFALLDQSIQFIDLETLLEDRQKDLQRKLEEKQSQLREKLSERSHFFKPDGVSKAMMAVLLMMKNSHSFLPILSNPKMFQSFMLLNMDAEGRALDDKIRKLNDKISDIQRQLGENN